MKPVILETLKKFGFQLQTSDVNFCTFNYGELNMLVVNTEEDETYLQVSIVDITSEEDPNVMSALVSQFNSNAMYAKAVIRDDSLWLTYERHFIGNEDYEDVIRHMLSSLKELFYDVFYADYLQLTQKQTEKTKSYKVTRKMLHAIRQKLSALKERFYDAFYDKCLQLTQKQTEEPAADEDQEGKPSDENIVISYQTIQTMMIKALEELEFKPLIDDDGNLYIIHQSQHIFFTIDLSDNQLITVLYPGFMHVEGEEVENIFPYCNQYTREMKQVKLYLEEDLDYLSACYQFYLTDEKSLLINLKRALHVLFDFPNVETPHEDTRQMLRNALREMNLLPQMDEDGDLLIDYQLQYIYFLVDSNDDQFITVLLPSFLQVNEEERKAALLLCNCFTREIKHLKFFLDPELNFVSASYQFYLTDKKSLAFNLEKALYFMSVAYGLYYARKIELRYE